MTAQDFILAIHSTFSAVLDSCDKHEVRGEVLENVLRWTVQQLVDSTLLDCVVLGEAEVTGWGQDGSPVFSFTTEGEARMREVFAVDLDVLLRGRR